jgi:hypothetical protein
MNYQWHYNSLIQKRINTPDLSDASELHHIIPLSIGGNDTPENIVRLSSREHFVAHFLLWRIHRNRPMAWAFRGMCNWKSKKNSRYIPSSRVYAEAKEAVRLNGHSSETRKKMSIARKRNHEILASKYKLQEFQMTSSDKVKAITGRKILMKNRNTGEEFTFKSIRALRRAYPQIKNATINHNDHLIYDFTEQTKQVSYYIRHKNNKRAIKNN